MKIWTTQQDQSPIQSTVTVL